MEAINDEAREYEKKKKKEVAVFKVAEAPTVRGFCSATYLNPELEKDL